MDLTNLTPDAKYSVAIELSGKDLVRLCSSDSEMRRLCSSEKFNPIWRQNIKTDFNIDYNGKHGYMEYLKYTYIFNQKFWIVTRYSTEEDSILGANIYQSYNEAFNGIVDEIEKYPMTDYKPTYPIIKAQLDDRNNIKVGEIKYEITEGSVKTSTNDREKLYQKQLDELADIAYEDEEDDQLKSDFKDDFDSALHAALEDQEFSFDSFWKTFSGYEPYNNHPKLSTIKKYIRTVIFNL